MGKAEETGSRKPLANNADLHSYLAELAEKMTARGRSDIAEILTAASNQRFAVPSTEFLGEARLVLRRLRRDDCVFTKDEQQQMRYVLKQLDAAFKYRR